MRSSLSLSLKSNMDRFIEIIGTDVMGDVPSLKSNMDRFIERKRQ